MAHTYAAHMSNTQILYAYESFYPPGDGVLVQQYTQDVPLSKLWHNGWHLVISRVREVYLGLPSCFLEVCLPISSKATSFLKSKC